MGGRSTRIAAALAALALLGGPTGAAAEGQPDAVTAQRAQAYIDLGTRLFKQRHFDEALAEFQRAAPLIADPTARSAVQHNIARCLEELGRVEAAVAAFEAYLAMPDAPAARKAAKARLDALRAARYGRLHVRGLAAGDTCDLERTSPPSTEQTPRHCGVADTHLLAGRYWVRVAGAPTEPAMATIAPGGLTEVAASGRAAAPVPLPLPADEAAPTDAAEAPTAENELSASGPASGPSAVPWLLAGAGAAALGGGVYFGLTMGGAVDDGDAAVKRMRVATTEADYAAARRDVRSADDTARQDRLLAYGLGGLGLAALGASAYLLLRPEPAALSLTPAPRGAGLAVRF